MNHSESASTGTGIPDGITQDDVAQAIADLEQGQTDHRFRDSTGYDLLYDGKRYPPKAVIGLAARRLRGRHLDPNEFSGGADSKCFSVLRNLGYQIVAKALPPIPDGKRIWFENIFHLFAYGSVPSYNAKRRSSSTSKTSCSTCALLKTSTKRPSPASQQNCGTGSRPSSSSLTLWTAHTMKTPTWR